MIREKRFLKTIVVVDGTKVYMFVVEQTHRREEFAVRDGEPCNRFTASSGYELYSNYFPEIYHSKVLLRGDDREIDRRVAEEPFASHEMAVEQAELHQAAVAEYNASNGEWSTKPATEETEFETIDGPRVFVCE